jgi:hypothetical protein
VTATWAMLRRRRRARSRFRITSGDQFNVYICGRLMVPALTPRQQREIGKGKLLLDKVTKDFIRAQLGYRFVVHPSGAEAPAERGLRAGQSPGRPFPNRCELLRGQLGSALAHRPPNEHHQLGRVTAQHGQGP